MELKEAVLIVLELAAQNQLQPSKEDELNAEIARQQEALDMVARWANGGSNAEENLS